MNAHKIPNSVMAVFVLAAVTVFAGSADQTPVSGTGVFGDTKLIPEFKSDSEIDKYVASCLRPTWEDIMRYPDDYVGKDIAFQGKADETESKTKWLTVYVSGKRNQPWWVASWNQTMRPRGLFLDGDEIAVFGRLRATESKNSNWRCPRIDARYIEAVSANHSIDNIVAQRTESFRKAEAKRRARSGGKAEFKWRTERIDAGGLRIFLDKTCLDTAFGNVVVPEEIDGIPVRILGNNAFSGFDSIKKVTLPPEVRAIGQKAFSGCTSLETLEIGNVAYIAADAFDECPKLECIVGPGFEYFRDGDGKERKTAAGKEDVWTQYERGERSRRARNRLFFNSLTFCFIIVAFVGTWFRLRKLARGRWAPVFRKARICLRRTSARFRRFSTTGGGRHITGTCVWVWLRVRKFARSRLVPVLRKLRIGLLHFLARLRRFTPRGKLHRIVSSLLTDMVSMPGKTIWMSKYEVTQQQWQSLTGKNPSKYKNLKCPVENVSWSDCQTFLKKLNATPDVKEAGLLFRLPTEEEWEFACRAGSVGCYGKDGEGVDVSIETLDKVAWFDRNSGGKTHPVGKKSPNAFGLYDMHGNVWEWTQSYEGEYYVMRGGSWSSAAEDCEASARSGSPISFQDKDVGFRLCADRKTDGAV